MKIYYGHFSGNSARAVFGLLESGVPLEQHIVDTRKKENKSPEYLALNPMGKIPALTDGKFYLWESNAINWYAAEKAPGSLLLPVSLEGQASVQRWLFFQSSHVTPASLPVFRATNARVQAFWGTKGDEAAAQTGRKELARFIPVLESALEGKDWLEGDFSLADIAYAPHFFFLRGGGFDESPYPRVRAWIDRMLARPAWKETERLVFVGA